MHIEGNKTLTPVHWANSSPGFLLDLPGWAGNTGDHRPSCVYPYQIHSWFLLEPWFSCAWGMASSWLFLTMFGGGGFLCCSAFVCLFSWFGVFCFVVFFWEREVGQETSWTWHPTPRASCVCAVEGARSDHGQWKAWTPPGSNYVLYQSSFTSGLFFLSS